jgi:hypothetical protein
MTLFLALSIAIAASGPANAATDRPWATIGTGSLVGVYYNVGQAIKKTFDRHPADPEINLSVEETRGSLENLEAVTSGRFYFGIIQSDVQFKAWNGVNGTPWAGRPQKNLRAVMSLYTEAVNLVASRQPNIQSLEDLTGRRRRVNLGEPGSGHYINAAEILAATGIDVQRDLAGVHAAPVRALFLFEQRDIDAFFFTAGHPAAQFHEVARGRRMAQFVPLNPTADQLARYPYYQRTFIPIKYYPDMGHEQNVATIGVKATVIASDETPDWMVYGLLQTIHKNIDYFKSQLLIFENINRDSVLEALTAPLHPGALQYYREIGMVP